MLPLFFLISTRSNYKHKYYFFYSLVIITTPILGALYQAHYFPSIFPNMKLSTGSSGIIAGLVGLTPAFWILCIISQNSAFKFRKRFAVLSVSYMMLSFLIIYFLLKNLILIIALSLIFLSALFLYRKSLFYILIEIGKEGRERFVSALILLMVPVLFILSPFIFLFPTFSSFSEMAIKTGTGVDFFTHFIGVVYGLVVSFVYFVFLDKETSSFQLKRKTPLARGYV